MVAMVVVLFPGTGETPTLHPGTLERLGELGVTSVALVQDASTAGLVLEGWAFDPARAEEAARVVAGARDGLRTLTQLAHVSVLRPNATKEEI
jgi:hypothetical protein